MRLEPSLYNIVPEGQDVERSPFLDSMTGLNVKMMSLFVLTMRLLGPSLYLNGSVVGPFSRNVMSFLLDISVWCPNRTATQAREFPAIVTNEPQYPKKLNKRSCKIQKRAKMGDMF